MSWESSPFDNDNNDPDPWHTKKQSHTQQHPRHRQDRRTPYWRRPSYPSLPYPTLIYPNLNPTLLHFLYLILAVASHDGLLTGHVLLFLRPLSIRLGLGPHHLFLAPVAAAAFVGPAVA